MRYTFVSTDFVCLMCACIRGVYNGKKKLYYDRTEAVSTACKTSAVVGGSAQNGIFGHSCLPRVWGVAYRERAALARNAND